MIRDAVLGEVYRRAVERVRFNNVATDLEKRAVNIFDGVGTRDDQVFVATFETWSTKVVERQVLDLKVGPHRSIEDDDAFF